MNLSDKYSELQQLGNAIIKQAQETARLFELLEKDHEQYSGAFVDSGNHLNHLIEGMYQIIIGIDVQIYVINRGK